MPHDTFEDREVAQCAIRITNAGDGLSEALQLNAADYHLDDTVYIVLRGTVAKITYERIKDTDEVRQVFTVRATLGTPVDEASARKTLDKLRRDIEAAGGVQRIPGTSEDDE